LAAGNGLFSQLAATQTAGQEIDYQNKESGIMEEDLIQEGSI